MNVLYLYLQIETIFISIAYLYLLKYGISIKIVIF